MSDDDDGGGGGDGTPMAVVYVMLVLWICCAYQLKRARYDRERQRQADLEADSGPPPPTAAVVPSDEEIDVMSVKELRNFISRVPGLDYTTSSAGCVEKEELRVRAKQAADFFRSCAGPPAAGDGPADAAGMSDEEIDGMSVKELREYIAQAGLPSADCVEKEDLRVRARQAADFA